MGILAKSYQMCHCHWTVFTILHQIQAALLFNNDIIDSKVCSGTKLLLVMLQSETPFILINQCIFSLICPKIMDHVIYALKSVQFWSQNSEQVMVSAQRAGWHWGWGGEVSRARETQRLSPNTGW